MSSICLYKSNFNNLAIWQDMLKKFQLPYDTEKINVKAISFSTFSQYDVKEDVKELEPNKVFLTVNGGVVNLVTKPLGIELEIRDYDVEGDWDEENESCKVDEDEDRYQEMIWESTVELP